MTREAFAIDCIQDIIEREGGYVLHEVKGDRGGRTYAGISERAHPDWTGWLYLDNGRSEDDKELQQSVTILYLENYWKRTGAHCADKRLAYLSFDCAVNCGAGIAIRLLQIAVGAKADGHIGPETQRKLNAAGELAVKRFAVAWVERYFQIVERDDSQKKFHRGWINRVVFAALDTPK